jgi:hypothetical protein
METSTIQLVCLTPSSGKHLRNKVTGNIAEYKVYLGRDDKASNYEEVSEQVYQEWWNKEEQKRIAASIYNPAPEVDNN